MTAEEREFNLEWFVEQKRKENEARENAGNRAASSEPKFGPAAT